MKLKSRENILKEEMDIKKKNSLKQSNDYILLANKRGNKEQCKNTLKNSRKNKKVSTYFIWSLYV